jgi:hypothetical protein
MEVQPGNGDMARAWGGAALVLIGAGLILSHPGARRFVREGRFATFVSAAVPLVQRVLRLKEV